jgi:hypothetical protein
MTLASIGPLSRSDGLRRGRPGVGSDRVGVTDQIVTAVDHEVAATVVAQTRAGKIDCSHLSRLLDVDSAAALLDDVPTTGGIRYHMELVPWLSSGL